jgi:hypothetical protein
MDILIYIILVVVAYPIYWATKVFLEKYFGRKGEYKADKQELPAITKMQEEIKSNYSIKTNKKISLNTDRSKTIHEFTEAIERCSVGYNVLRVDEYTSNNYKDINVAMQVIRNNFQAAGIAYGKLKIYLNNKEFVIASGEVFEKLLYFHYFMEATIKDLRSTFERMDFYFKMAAIGEIVAPESQKEMVEDVKKVKEEQENIISNWKEMLVVLLSDLGEKHRTFLNLSHQFLNGTMAFEYEEVNN